MEIRLVVTRGEGGWWLGEMSKGVNCMVMDGNQNCRGDHSVVHTDVEL